ncbi:hypothetical protein [Micromonospora sp. 15K316]|uniref:hypothetical protein n=1 Tax=Micromonospora sp. 15K316 TaxID=2530376 RepID=UPI001AA00A1F|nr:hypothetical protein [Micromonospora sp. 15K316]
MARPELPLAQLHPFVVLAEEFHFGDAAAHLGRHQTLPDLPREPPAGDAAGRGVSLAPASIRRIRLDGVAFRRIEPGTARTRVAVAWLKKDQNPLVTHLLATVSRNRAAAQGEEPPCVGAALWAIVVS